MPTRVRSIWQRFAEPIPPPTVCRTEPVPLVQAGASLTVTLQEQTKLTPSSDTVWTKVTITIRSIPAWDSSSVNGYSTSYADSLEQPEPIDPIDDEPKPAPSSPVTDIVFERDTPKDIAFATRYYDAVVTIRLYTTERVLYNLYIDLGRLSRKKEPAYG